MPQGPALFSVLTPASPGCPARSPCFLEDSSGGFSSYGPFGNGDAAQRPLYGVSIPPTSSPSPRSSRHSCDFIFSAYLLGVPKFIFSPDFSSKLTPFRYSDVPQDLHTENFQSRASVAVCCGAKPAPPPGCPITTLYPVDKAKLTVTLHSSFPSSS